MRLRAGLPVLILVVAVVISSCNNLGITFPTSTPLPALSELRLHMLTLINRDRGANGLEPVVLGNNAAAQQHAEEMHQQGYLSHWGRDGLKPYMRYTLNGGANYSSENVSGPNCARNPTTNYAEVPVLELLENAQNGLMNSPGHRRNILNKWHTSVNLGIACDSANCSIVQLFEGNYLRFTDLPTIRGGVLTLAGEILGGFTPVQIDVWYDEPPQPLTLGQLGRTHSYSVGQKPAVFIRKPLKDGFHYEEDFSEYSWTREIDPYMVDPQAPPPERISTGGVEKCEVWPITETTYQSIVPWVTAAEFEVTGSSFQVTADLDPILSNSGPGVYTLIVWGELDGELVGLTEYSLFWR